MEEDIKKKAEELGIDPADMPEEEMEHPADVAEPEVIDYGNGD